ncbi:MAG: 3-phosphoshikimate 1-carboxyvinyltransferase, partial [Candidatus Eremiobacteraeota bacterium]|nr:3-phosphoshikimate 1-carboxyvinyltransferase [Candidatus Eremiobacteraeota bacterium]
MTAVTPARGLRGTIRVPGDKSIGHRALFLGALAEGTTHVAGLSDGDDVASTRRCLTALGLDVRDGASRGSIAIEGSAGHLSPPSGVLDCGNSGTTMRLLAALLASQPFAAILDGDASLRSRPMRRIAEPLREMGAQVELSSGDVAPIRIRGGSLHGIRYTLPIASAQLRTALIFAGLAASGTTRLEGKLGARDHTERMLPLFGGALELDDGHLTLHGPQRLRAPAAELVVPGDLSSAAYWIAAATIVPGSRIEIECVGLNPTRIGFI